MNETPHVWSSHREFIAQVSTAVCSQNCRALQAVTRCLMFQVGLKLYMFIPAVILGVILGVFLWSLAMLALRTFGLIKKKVLSEKSRDLEMFPSSPPDKISEKVSYSGPPGFSSRLSSSHSSPVSLSSGIGVSERESESSADSCQLSCDCGEAGEAEGEREGEPSSSSSSSGPNSKLILTQHQRSR